MRREFCGKEGWRWVYVEMVGVCMEIRVDVRFIYRTSYSRQNQHFRAYFTAKIPKIILVTVCFKSAKPSSESHKSSVPD